ncbi:conserved hypothetical lipoprotein [Mycoplasmoides gallisepticum CA06_2006.052-5-2P]|uniref:Conserved hypothetical lipoprotein n=1 Tax=Mycoplasmoides gallisepticum WI01_2001.043-13-2P TaxID=1159201 RepID=J3VH86_MYCGL|nr:hypothetical protein [Mycoplasmoides gallisepticum]AFP75991.1 conserved hypothetical lipoprotein [Mycoplasmoides gallisepticum VA94_7994-1-7P]AFP76758.1 conserved hypothetical lipoprotein [Mycoplasmoides gallisepticum NC95_13295-2-2P]AFP77512.1 conserved hypothetical lipoprotein [Mycoplasmoides gallisepticum NC96_1596-4-2P]AFP78283.1 conserved hypothetical lipoprotein [Mycoplasmoides gallisepticum NY01_2001.047-5-1P]AFP79043.1 conserved hypothetical lipoprotein [Mycoplasmoides gallisepticum
MQSSFIKFLSKDNTVLQSKKSKIIWTLFKSFAVVISPIAFTTLASCYAPKDNSKPPQDNNKEPKIGINLASFDKLNNATDLLEWKDPESKTSEMEIGNILKNKFIKNNLQLKVDQIKQILADDYKVSQNDLANYSFDIKYNEVFYDRNNPDQLVVPTEILRKVQLPNLTSSNLYKGHVYNLILAGFKPDNKYARFDEYKNKIKEFKAAHPIQKVDLDNLDLRDLLGYSQAKLKSLKIEFKDFNNSDLYQGLSNQEKIDQANTYSSKKTFTPKYSAFVKSVKISDDLKKLHFTIRIAYGFSSYQWNNDFNSYGEDLQFDQDINKELTEQDYQKIALANLNIQLADFSSITNYDFANFNVDDFYPFSKNKNLIKFKIIQAINPSVQNKNATFKIKTSSDLQQLNNLDLEQIYGVKKHLNLFSDPQVGQSTKIYDLHTGLLGQEQLSKISSDLFTYLNNTNAIAGGYGQIRGFYASNKTPAQLHLGEDILVNANTLLKSPVDADVVSVFDRKSDNIGAGIGTSVILRIKAKDLSNMIDQGVYEDYFASSEYVYLGIIHLDGQKTQNQLNQILNNQANVNRQLNWINKDKKDSYLDITLDNPLSLKANDAFAVVGESDQNGGWLPHAHIALMADSSLITDPNGYVYPDRNNYLSPRNLDRINNPAKRPFFQVPGVAFVNRPTTYYKTDPNANEIMQEVDGKQTKVLVNNDLFIDQNINIQSYETRGLLDPNLLFQFRNQDTYIAKLRDYFKESFPNEPKLQE